MMLMQYFCGFVFLNFFIKAYVVGYSFELHQIVDAIEMGTHKILMLL